MNRKFTLEIDGKLIAAELFRRTNKALTITGLTLNPTIHELTNIDRVIDWGVVWGERRKAAAAAEKRRADCRQRINGGGCGYNVDEIEQIVREGAPAGKNRSETFHTSSATISAVAGMPSRSSLTCSNSRPASAAVTSVKAGSEVRLLVALISMPPARCRRPASTVGLMASRRKRRRRRPTYWMRSWMKDPEIDDAPPLQRDVELEKSCRSRIRS